MLVDFIKMNGAGNDFILIDNRNGHLSLTTEQIVRLCHRQKGIGADGLILLENCKSGQADFAWGFYNSDGSEAGKWYRVLGSAPLAQFVQTAFGRRLWLPDIASSRIPVQKAAERAAINAPMQGTAADLIKMAMVAVQRWLEETGAASRMILQVHDELILEVPQAEVETVREALPRLMAGVASLKVPLVAEVGVADNWEAAH